MKVLLTNTSLFVEQASKEVHELISETLKVRDPGAFFNPSYNKKWWDGYKKFYDKRSNRCDSGFLEQIIDLCQENDIELELEDGRRPVKKGKLLTTSEWHEALIASGIKAHPVVSKLQRKSAYRGLNQYIADGIPWPRGVFNIATGGGKTSLMALLAKAVDKPTLIMLGRVDLMYQTKEALEEVLGEEIGMIGDMLREPKRVTILMTQTASKLVQDDEWVSDFLKKQKMIILDEAHHLKSGSRSSKNNTAYYDVIRRCTNAYYRYALSATAFKRNDPGDAQLVGLFGSEIIEIKSKTLRDVGALAEVRAFIVEEPDKEKLPKTCDRKSAKRTGIYNSSVRNSTVVSLAKMFESWKYPCLILVAQELIHGEHLQETFEMMCGERPPLINYKMHKKKRRELLTELENHKIPYIIASTGVFGEGVNAPNIRALIRAEGGDNEIRTLQAAGRGMRRKENPNELFLIDFWDLNHKHLEKDSRRRLAVYDEEEYSVTVVQSIEEIQQAKDQNN